ncbi:MAG: sigma-70 family RNA polymerase sigma factor [Candidatus Eisenbacteria sp.]|nr:sigma-70 family RNA polymerase sigma factor [Candidatus Eisenbacteria bacterium]
MSDSPAYGGVRHLEELSLMEDRHKSLSFEEAREAVLTDDDGWRVFVEKYSRFVYTVTLRLLSGPIARKEDLAQEIYCSVFSRIQQDDYRVLRRFQSRCKFTTYLFRMVQTARSTVLRREGQEADRTDFVDFSDEANRGIQAALAEGEDPGPELPSCSPEKIRKQISRAVQGLSPREKLLVKFRFQKGLKLRELASALGYRDTNDAAYALRKTLKSLELLDLLEPGEWTGIDRDIVLGALNKQLFQ